MRDSKNPKTIQENDGKGSYYKDICAKCGAVRIDDQIGLEQTPQDYVDNLVQVFGECWRILRDDGTVWVVLGTSYANKNIESSEMTLRDDLTNEEIDYVFSELSKYAKKP